MNIEFYNGIFLLNDTSGNYYIHKGSMTINNGVVVGFDLFNGKSDIKIDLRGKLVTPTLKNAHLHLGETLFRPLIGQWTLEKYLKYTEECNKRYTKNEVDVTWERFAKITLNECIEYGVGTICTIRGYSVLKDYKLKSLSGYPIMKSDKLKKFIDYGIDGYKNFYNYCKNNDIVPGIFIHSLYYNDKSSIEFAKKCMKYGGEFIGIHVAETEKSELQVQRNWNFKRSIEVLIENDMLNKNTLLIHGGYLSENELKSISKYGAKIVICPVSNHKLSTKFVDYKLLDKYEINWCLGTDGLATGETANMLYHTSFFKSLSDISSHELLKSVTFNASSVMNKYDNQSLSVGSSADFNIYSCSNACLSELSFDEIVDILVSNQLNLEMTYIDGVRVK